MIARRLALPLVVAGLVAAATLAALAPSPARASTSQDVTIASPDGTKLTATLTLPDGAPPAGGWPAIVFLHGLAGTRDQGLSLAEAMDVTRQYAVLAFDARGHGGSGGLVGLDGPSEIADTRAVFEWLRDRPDVSDRRIGAFGISYGGGAVLNTLAAGLPWAAAETCITFSDLARALYPQRLAKSGVIATFVSSLDPARVDPATLAARDAAFRGDTPAVVAFAGPRSSIRGLGAVRTPVYVMQGRRDFAFDLDQGLPGYAVLGGPRKLWIGNIGHGVSSFPGPDTPAMLADGKRWFDRFLLDERNGVDEGPKVTIASEGSARTTSASTLPPTRTQVFRTARAASFTTPATRGTWTLGTTTSTLEVFGAPTVTADATASGGWSRLVAVFTARTKAGTKVIAVGGAPVAQGRSKVAIRLISTATVVPRGAGLALTLASSSTSATGAAGLVYLDLPMPDTARIALKGVSLSLPVLRKPVSG